jgi:hypothetical protein
VLTTLGAARSGPRLRRGKAQPLAETPGAAPLPLTRATLIRPRPFGDEAAAERWLAEVCGDRELWSTLAREAATELNRLLHAHRTAAGDPYVADVDAARAVAVRFGYGTGDEVADGRWRAANELGEPERRKLVQRDYEALRPQERVAAVLAGREVVGPHEDLIVRARGDLDAGRIDAAALGLDAALRAMAAGGSGLSAAAEVATAAQRTVLDGGTPDRSSLEAALREAETAIRKRALG